jgi:hypothetical protein
VIYHLYRDAFSEVYTYRYRLTDAEEKLVLSATWAPPPSGTQPEEIRFQDADEADVGMLRWEEHSWWRGDRFHLMSADQQRVALIQEVWNLVDRMLLRFPYYRMDLADGNRLEARGSRYGDSFYRLFVLPADEEKAVEGDEIKLGEITHPTAGPTYVLETQSPLLTSAPLLVAGLMAVIDFWGREKAEDAR